MLKSYNIENLVFEGGGVKGIAFAGAIKCLEENGILQGIKRVAGSSAGAWAATLIAIGFDSNKFEKNLTEIDFNQFTDANKGMIGFVKNAFRLLLKYSWHKGDNLDKYIGETLENETGNRDITFLEVYKQYGKELVITATNIDRAHSIYFHHKSYPDLPVRIAIRASMAIPLYFKPVKFEGDYLVDGGLLNNYPIWFFDTEIMLCTSQEVCNCLNPQNSVHFTEQNITKPSPNLKTLGLKLVGEDESPDDMIFHGRLNTSKFRHYVNSIISCITWQIERSSIKPGYWERTVIIPTNEIKTTDFDLNYESKVKLYESGYNSTKTYLENRIDKGKDKVINGIKQRKTYKYKNRRYKS